MNVLQRVQNVAIGEVAVVNPKGPGAGILAQDDVLDFLPMADLSEDGTMAVSAQRPYAEVSKGYTAFRGGDILLAKITPCFENNKIALADVETDWAFGSTEFHVIRPGKDVDARYLLHFLRQDAIRVAGEKRMTGSGGQRRVPRSFLEELPIPLPPLPEQKRIAAILDQADALRRLRRRALDRLNTLGQAIFQEMFVGAPGDWPTVKIEEVVSDARTGPFGSQLLHSEFVDAGIPVLGIDNVVSNEFIWAEPRFITAEKYRGLRRYTISPGDILITIMGTCGRCAIVPDDTPTAINTKHICCLTPDRSRATSEYLRAVFLMHPAVLRQLGVEAKGAVMPGLNMGIIKRTEIPLPPLDLQRRFGERIRRVKRQDNDARRQASSIDALFASLQHSAFTGQL